MKRRPLVLTLRSTMIGLLAMAGCAHQTQWTGSDRILEGIAAFPAALHPETNALLSLEWHEESRCSVLAENVDREALVHALLEGGKHSYSCPPFSLAGRVSFRLQRVDVIQALNACLRDLELEASLLNTSPPLIVIRETPDRAESPQSDNASQLALSAKSVALINSSAKDLVSSLFKGTTSRQGLLSSQAIPLQVGVSPETNSIYLRGQSEAVERALHMTRLADQRPSALRVEVFSYVSRPNQDTLQTSANWKLNQGPISLRWDPVAESDQGISVPLSLSILDSQASNETLTFKALHAREQGELLARAELVVVSGQSFLLHVGKTGYILVPEFENGTPAAITKLIDVGSKLQITPQLLPDRSIRLALMVETSKFNPISSGTDSSQIIGNKNLNQRNVTVQVPQHSMIVVGGLRRPQTNFSLLNGLSGLRRLPALNRLLGNYVEDESLEQVMTLVRISEHNEKLLPSTSILIPSAIPVCDEPQGLTNLSD
jgi:hypothetical protein